MTTPGDGENEVDKLLDELTGDDGPGAPEAARPTPPATPPRSEEPNHTGVPATTTAAPVPAVARQPARRSLGSRLLLPLLALALLALGSATGWWLATRGLADDEVATAAPEATNAPTTENAETEADGETQASVDGETADAEPEPEITTSSLTTPPDTIDPVTGRPYPATLAGLTPAEVLEADYPRVVIENRRFRLAGRYPSMAVAEANATNLRLLYGEENVDIDYSIDPNVPFYMSSAVIISDVVAFEFNSTEVRDEYLWLVEVGLGALTFIPGSTLTINAYADAAGSEAVNLRISQERADNLKALLTSQGVDPDRVTAVGLGEVEASDDDDEAAAERHRRAEFLFVMPPGALG